MWAEQGAGAERLSPAPQAVPSCLLSVLAGGGPGQARWTRSHLLCPANLAVAPQTSRDSCGAEVGLPLPRDPISQTFQGFFCKGRAPGGVDGEASFRRSSPIAPTSQPPALTAAAGPGRSPRAPPPASCLPLPARTAAPAPSCSSSPPSSPGPRQAGPGTHSSSRLERQPQPHACWDPLQLPGAAVAPPLVQGCSSDAPVCLSVSTPPVKQEQEPLWEPTCALKDEMGTGASGHPPPDPYAQAQLKTGTPWVGGKRARGSALQFYHSPSQLLCLGPPAGAEALSIPLPRMGLFGPAAIRSFKARFFASFCPLVANYIIAGQMTAQGHHISEHADDWLLCDPRSPPLQKGSRLALNNCLRLRVLGGSPV